MEKIIRFFKDEDGLELSEYAVMGALLLVGLLLVITGLGTQIKAVFNSIITMMGGSAIA